MSNETTTARTLRAIREEFVAPYRDALNELWMAATAARNLSYMDPASVRRFVDALDAAEVVLTDSGRSQGSEVDAT